MVERRKREVVCYLFEESNINLDWFCINQNNSVPSKNCYYLLPTHSEQSLSRSHSALSSFCSKPFDTIYAKRYQTIFSIFSQNTLPLTAYQKWEKVIGYSVQLLINNCWIIAPDRTNQLEIYCQLLSKFIKLSSTHLNHFNIKLSFIYESISPSGEVSLQKCDLYISYQHWSYQDAFTLLYAKVKDDLQNKMN